MLLLHASCVNLKDGAVILRGASGAGKSDLALRLVDDGADLVADDQVALEQRDGRLMARAPQSLAGLIEIRGLGILRLPHATEVPVALIVDLDPNAAPERLPERSVETLLAITLPHITLDPFQASAPARVRAAMTALSNDTMVAGALAIAGTMAKEPETSS